ncbi:krueppel-like factor [Trichophyton mentagrophytes]|nr:krueppel-like factor [Trichophyton mentagrophytes]
MPLTPHTPLLTPTMVSPVDGTPFIGYCSPNLSVHRPTPMKLYRSRSEGTVGMPSTMTARKCAPKSQRRDNVNVSMPVTYTPATHRVSKAKKGKRVHACQFPGCSKVFTRAEHRRRHELNHNPQATFVCTINGCGKGFHRSDLLSRHMEKHEQDVLSTKPTIGHKRRISQISDASDAIPMSSPSVPVPHSVPNSAQIPPVTPELHSLQATHSPYLNTQLLSPPYWTSFRRASDPSIGYSSITYSAGDESSLFSSPECSRSPSSDSSHGAHFPFSTSHITGIGIFHEPMVDPTIMGNSLPYDSSFGGFQAVDSTVAQTSPLVTLPGDDDSTRTVVQSSYDLA